MPYLFLFFFLSMHPVTTAQWHNPAPVILPGPEVSSDDCKPMNPFKGKRL